MSYIVAGDFGATNKRLRAVRLLPTREVLVETTFRAHGTESIEETVRRFVAELPSPLSLIAIGAPGRVSPDRRACWLSYLPGEEPLSLDSLVSDGFAERVAFLNDVEAGAWALATRSIEQDVLDLRSMSPAELPAESTRSCLIMPGTGVGIAFVGPGDHVRASEGGNALGALRPGDAAERRLLEMLSDAPWPPYEATYDSLASGAGLYRLFEVQARLLDERSAIDLVSDTDPHLRGLEVSRLAHSDPPVKSAIRAISLSATFLGRASQCAVLMDLAPNLVLAGSVISANVEILRGPFLDGLDSHPRHAEFLASVSVFVIRGKSLNLDGAESFAASRLPQAEGQP